MNRGDRAARIDAANKINPHEPFDIVISLAGGGVNGVGSIAILQEVERIMREQYNAPFSLTDITNDPRVTIVGCSVGAINACLLKEINPDTGRPITLSEIQAVYSDIVPAVFKPTWRWLSCLWRAPCQRGPLADAGRHFIQNKKISDRPDLGMVALRKKTGKLELFARHVENEDALIRDAAEASAALPCVFAPKGIHFIHDDGTEEIAYYADGGKAIWDSDPVVEAWRLYVNRRQHEPDFGHEQTLLIDIGAGQYHAKNRTYQPENHQGGFINACRDGTFLNFFSTTQKSGLDTVEDLTHDHAHPVQIETLDFERRSPIAWTEKYLQETRNRAVNSVRADPSLQQVAKLLVDWKMKDIHTPPLNHHHSETVSTPDLRATTGLTRRRY